MGTKKAGHTPGPWHVKPEGHKFIIGAKSVSGFASRLELGTVDKEANARLIAAAPELLKAAKEMMGVLQQLSTIETDAETKLKEAIAKAEGK